jgi:phage repressor protein C with HTH and peptisase S24 domain
MDITTIIDKIKDIISSDLPNRRVFDKDVASALGLSKESLTHFKKRNSIPYEQIAYFCAKKKISINWLLFDQEPKSLEEQTEKYSRIKYFKDINASAGGGAFNFDEDYELLAIDKEFLNNLYKSHSVNIENIAAINVIGDSMEPTLLNQEVILFDTTMTDIEKDGIFVISSNSGLFVKRIAKRVDGSIELISDNKNYNSENVSISEQAYIRLLGKVIGKVGLV